MECRSIPAQICKEGESIFVHNPNNNKDVILGPIFLNGKRLQIFAKVQTEEKLPQLEKDIRSLVEPDSQTDPKFQTLFKYTRMTAKAVRQALIDKKG